MAAAAETKVEIPVIGISELESSSSDLKLRLVNAAKTGFFYVELTSDWKPYLSAAVRHAESFECRDEGKLLEPGDEGKPNDYPDHPVFGPLRVPINDHRMPGYQGSSFRVLDRKLWDEKLGQDVKSLGDRMAKLCHTVLVRTLQALDVPSEMVDRLCHGASTSADAESSSADPDLCFTFNRYDPSIAASQGLVAHQDSGLVTALFIDKLGLEARLGDDTAWTELPPDDGYTDVVPKDNHLVMNFGRALAISFREDKSRNVLAPWHRVRQVDEKRVSFALFYDRPIESTIFQMTEDGCVPVKSKEKPDKNMSRTEFGLIQNLSALAGES